MAEWVIIGLLMVLVAWLIMGYARLASDYHELRQEVIYLSSQVGCAQYVPPRAESHRQSGYGA